LKSQPVVSKSPVKKAWLDDSVSHAQTSTSSSSSSSSSSRAIMCVVCNRYGCMGDTVRCDECMLFYHLNCLDPPMKKSPKVRGYAWHCEACDMLDNSMNWAIKEQEKEDKPGFPLKFTAGEHKQHNNLNLAG
ncbi:unnamed protein product, partial [Candidula unifasciata]